MTAQRLAAGTRLGPYEIVSLLGAGGMGEVYRARDPRLHREVAIKVLPAAVASDPHRLRRFEQEALATASLNHPHILAVYDIGTSDGAPYVVSELLQGQTLRARLDEGGRIQLPLSWVLDVARQVVRGLSAAHAKGIVHRDLKPDNLFVTSDGRVKILDFGLAKLTQPDDAEGTRTDASVGLVLGTPGYMAPEQVRGHPVDRRADIFSLGAILYEMLAERRAFTGVSASDAMSAILRDDPPSLAQAGRDIPPSLATLVQRCLNKQPDDRFASADDVGAALDALPATIGGTRRGDHVRVNENGARALWRPVAQSRGWRRSRLAAVVGGGALALALILWRASSVHERGAPVGDVASIVALPAQIYGAADYAYLADAVPATLSTYLTGIEGLETKVPPSASELQPIRGDLARVADVYGATLCVLSSVTADAQQLTLNVQLVEPRTRRVQWSQHYEGRRERYLNLVRQAARELQLVLRPRAAVKATPVPTASSEAELALRRGQHYAERYNNRHNAGDLAVALGELTRALELDPKLSEAAAEIAYLHLYRQNAGVPAREAIPDAERWAQQALQIDPRCAKAWAALVWAEQWQPGASMRKELEFGLKAAHFGRRCAACQTSLQTALAGSLELGLVAQRQALEIDPLSVIARVNSASALTGMGRTTEALPLLEEALDLEPDSPVVLEQLAISLADVGRTSEALALIERLRTDVTEKREPEFFVLLAHHFVARAVRRDEDADRMLARILNEYTNPASSTSGELGFVQQDTVPSLARYGRPEAALEVLRRTARAGAIPPYDWLLLNPHLKPLQQDSRFREVAAKAKAQFDGMLQILDESRGRGEMPDYLDEPLADLRHRLGA